MVEQTGIALVTTHNTRSSTGAIGYYAGQIARDGHIGLVLAGSPKVMAVEGGIDPVLGTNPVAIAVPTGGQPLVLDMATAAIAWFSVIDARNREQPLPPDVALDATGQPTTDPIAALSGALKTEAKCDCQVNIRRNKLPVACSRIESGSIPHYWKACSSLPKTKIEITFDRFFRIFQPAVFQFFQAE